MRLLRGLSTGPSPYLQLCAVFLFASTCLAQNVPQLPPAGKTTGAAATEKGSSAAGPASTPAPNSASASNSPSPAGSDPGSSSAAPTSGNSPSGSPSGPPSGSSTPVDSPSSKGAAIITPTGSVATTQSAPVRITGSGSSAALGGSLPHNLPTLSGAFSYPPPSVPPTAHAPFMQQSTLPEGTVFIIVGAILGFLACSVLAWRGLVAWSVHRSVKRAAMQQNMSDLKVKKLRPRGSGFYSAAAGSTLSLDHLSSNVRGSTFGPKSHLSTGSLFYSPTAHAGTGADPPGNRASSYLPAGYYAAGTAAPGGGSGMTHLGTAQAQGYSRARSAGPSPPVSPSLSPNRGAEGGYPRASHMPAPSQGSTSTVNLSVPPQGRAPSAYLEDLFESHQSHPRGHERD